MARVPMYGGDGAPTRQGRNVMTYMTRTGRTITKLPGYGPANVRNANELREAINSVRISPASGLPRLRLPMTMTR